MRGGAPSPDTHGELRARVYKISDLSPSHSGPLLGHRQTQLTLVGGWGVKLQSALDHAQVKRGGER